MFRLLGEATFIFFGSFKLNSTKGQGAVIVTLMSALALASHFKVYIKGFYLMGKVLTEELSCTRTDLVASGSQIIEEKICFSRSKLFFV